MMDTSRDKKNTPTPTNTASDSRNDGGGKTYGNSKSKGFYKGKKPYNNKFKSKGYQKDEGCDTSNSDKGSSHYKTNDPAWYAKTAQLLTDSASLSFNNAVGARFSYATGSVPTGASFFGIANQSMPGICKLRMTTIPGVALDASAPLNVAARNIYSYVRHANSGHSNYDSPDLMLYLLGMDQLYSMYSWMTRLYGVMRAYDQKNRYMANGLVTVMGFDFNDMSANLANLRYFINQFGLKLSALYTPSTMDLYKRHTYIYSGVWKDSDAEKAQFYITSPNSFSIYDPTTQTTGGSLKAVAVPAAMTYAELVAYVTPFLEAILSDEDMNIMSGDIKKAYGESLYSLVLVPEDYVAFPIYDEVFLSQIQNSVSCGQVSVPSCIVKQSSTVDYLICDPLFQCVFPFTSTEWADPSALKRVLTIRKDKIDPADVMEATRLSCVRERLAYGGAWYYHMTSSAAEFITDISVWKFVLNGISGEWEVSPCINLLDSEIYINLDTWTTADASVLMANIADFEKFDWHPGSRVITYSLNDELIDLSLMGEFMDVDNYTLIGESELSKMNETALLSLFGVPQP